MKFLTIFLTLLGISLLGALAYTLSGLFNVAATVDDAAALSWLLGTTVEQSVERRSRGIEVPALTSRDMALAGLSTYTETCAQCHGEPGEPRGILKQGLNPTPPDLEHLAEKSAAEQFWIFLSSPHRPHEEGLVVAKTSLGESAALQFVYRCHSGLLRGVRIMKGILPEHIGFIPDGNRRWAVARGLSKEMGYTHGIAPGLELFEACKSLGIPEISVYGFTKDNTRRPVVQKRAFSRACVELALEIARRGAALAVIGDDESSQFPTELLRFRTRQGTGIKVNLLVNYGWEWDLQGIKRSGCLRSQPVSRMDMVVRWGGGYRLSGFLPVQAVYADFFVLEEHWPEFQVDHLHRAMDWFRRQDRTLGG